MSVKGIDELLIEEYQLKSSLEQLLNEDDPEAEMQWTELNKRLGKVQSLIGIQRIKSQSMKVIATIFNKEKAS